MLIAFSGLPGTGKSTLANGLARELPAAYVRVDSIEQAVREAGLAGDDIGPAGYSIGFRVATDNLRAGLKVVADSVNPIALTREGWRRVSTELGVDIVEVEIVCSDPGEHRRRVETRTVDVAGLALPSWSDVTTRRYDAWTRERIVIDTAGRSAPACLEELIEALGLN